MKSYSLEEFAKYNTITVLGALQERAGMIYTREIIKECYEAILMDLKTGAMERSCKEFDKKLKTHNL
jgi:hypothetical protein